jgi:hypothetical protein
LSQYNFFVRKLLPKLIYRIDSKVDPLLTAVVDERFVDALEDAKKVDRILSSLGAAARKQLQVSIQRNSISDQKKSNKLLS